MLSKDAVVKVTNRGRGSVGYKIPEMGITRRFQKGEIKEVTMQELRQLSYMPGGQVLLRECLLVHDDEALKELNPDYEPEYFYTEAEVRNLLLHGTQEQFLDCLDFAPEGVIGLIKDIAVEIKLNDLLKRDAIYKKTGFNVTKAIAINEMSVVTEEEEETKTRRAAAPVVAKADPEVTGRRTAPITTGKYSVKK